MLFQLGAVTFDTYPLNADETSETFGHDFAVKPVVGAQQPRESMGASDHHFTLSGELQPYFMVRNGQSSGLGDLATLKAMADAGEPQILVRGDGTNMGWWLIEKGSLKSNTLSLQGIGNVIHHSVELVESPTGASPASILSLLTSLFD